jgi:transmembrane sensor
MTDDSDFDPALIDRYLSGELTPDERAHAERWLADRPVTAEMLRALPTAALGSAAHADTNASWAALSARIANASGTAIAIDDLSARRARQHMEQSERVSTRGTPWLRQATRIAAALALVVGGATIWQFTRGTGGMIEAPLGREVTATLPDGSTVKLAAGSRVRWTASFHRRRDLTLEGEGYFVVQHDASHPFRVFAGEGKVEDIGTRFVVRSWPELMNLEVAVEEGIVALSDTINSLDSDNTPRELRAGQRGELQADGRVVISDNAATALAWTRGQLAFDNARLPEVLLQIGRRFDVDLRADSSMLTRRLSAQFDATSLSDVLDALALSLNVRIERHERMITLHTKTR